MSKKVAAQLKKLQGDEWDSDSDSEQAPVTFDASQDFVTLEAPAPSKKQQKKAAKKLKQDAAGTEDASSAAANTKQSNVIYLGRIPHGFYEKQMQGFFKQFGVVKRLRLSRNKRTGNSKHYAFVQFEEPEVAAIVARTMNEYRLFDHTLSCHLVPAHAVHERLFVGAGKLYKPVPWTSIARNKHNAEKTYEQTLAQNKRLVLKEKAKRKALKALGIEYDFPGYAAQVPAKKTHIAFD
uniref:RRM domain-containing protein n=1 Tax=Globisporangium ultimum (strain ATCC 200006 / CBS 805.95 / DAOM BR144) TaxID=431595 RepID=K3X1Z3_GLOUD